MSFVRRPGAAAATRGDPPGQAMAMMKRQRLEDAAVGVFPYAALPRELSQLGVDRLDQGAFGVVTCAENFALAYVRRDNHLYFWRLTKDRRKAKCMRLSLPPQIKAAAGEGCFVSAFAAAAPDTPMTASMDLEDLGLFLVTTSGVVCCWPSVDARTVPVVETLPLAAGSRVSTVNGDGVYLAAGATYGDIFVVWLSPEDLCLHVKHCSESIPAAPTEQPGGVAGFVNRFFSFGGGSAAATEPAGAAGSAAATSSSSSTTSSVTSSAGGASDAGGAPEIEVTDLLIRVSDNAANGGSAGPARVSVFTLFAGREAITRWDLDPASMQTSCAWTLTSLSKALAPNMHVSHDAIRLHRLGLAADRLVLMASSPGRGVMLHEIRGIEGAPCTGRCSSLLSLPDSLDYSKLQFAHSSSPQQDNKQRCIALLAHEVYDDATPSLQVHALEFPSRRNNPDGDVWATDEKQDVTTGWFALAGAADKVDGFLLTATCVLGIRLDGQAHAGAASSAAARASEGSIRTSGRALSAASPRVSAASVKSARGELYADSRKIRPRSGRAVPGRAAGGFGDLEKDAKTALKTLRSAFNAFEQESALGRDGMVVAKDVPQFDKLAAATSEVLDYAVIGLGEHILDAKPNQRWADRQAMDPKESESFSGRLIMRHLVNKQARFGSSGLLGFLERAGILEGLSHEALVRLANQGRRLTASKTLCALQDECAREQGATADSRRARCVSLILQAVQRELVLSRTKLSAAALDAQLEESGLSVADLFYSGVTDIESVIEFVVSWLYGKNGDRDALTDILAANKVVLAVFSPKPIESEALAELAQPETTLRAWTRGAMVMENLASLLEVTRNSASSNPGDFGIWKQYFELVSIYLSGQRRGEASEEVRNPADTVDDSNWKQLIDQEEASALIGAFDKQRITEEVFWQQRAGGLWWKYDLALAFACHEQLFRACLELDEIPHELFVERARYKDEKGSHGSFLQKALVESVSSHIALRDRSDGGLLDFVGVKGQFLRGVPAEFVGDDEQVPGWRMERWTVAQDTIRWSFRATHVDGPLLSFDGAKFSVVRAEVPGDRELFQILPVSGGAGGASPRFAPRSTNESQTYRVLTWDNITYLGMNDYGIAEGVSYAPQRDGFAPSVLEYLFQAGAENLSLILQVVEDGALNAPMENFLQRHQGGRSQQAALVHQLGWLNSLRLHNYGAAIESLRAHRDVVKDDKDSSILYNSETLQSLEELSQLAI